MGTFCPGNLGDAQRDQVNRPAAITACQKRGSILAGPLEGVVRRISSNRASINNRDAPTAHRGFELHSIRIYPSSLAASPFAQLPGSAHLRGQGGLSHTVAVARTP